MSFFEFIIAMVSICALFKIGAALEDIAVTLRKISEAEFDE